MKVAKAKTQCDVIIFLKKLYVFFEIRQPTPAMYFLHWLSKKKHSGTIKTHYFF